MIGVGNNPDGGSHVYEINAWPQAVKLWQLEALASSATVGGLSVAKPETKWIRNKSRSEAAWRAWKTKNAPGRKRLPTEEEESS